MSNGRLYCSSAFEPALLLLAQTLELTPVNDFLVWVVSVHPAKAQIDHDVFELDGNVLRQVGCLLKYGTQNVAVVRVAREGAGTQHQAMFMGDHHGALDAKLIGLFGFALSDALNLWRMQCVQLVLAVSLLGLNTCCTLKP